MIFNKYYAQFVTILIRFLVVSEKSQVCILFSELIRG